MQLKTLFEDEDAVSPVIGVILMVAITVILAAVIGTFVLGLGEQVGNAQPSTTFDFDYESGATGGDTDLSASGTVDGVLTITHNGGDDIRASELTAKDDDGDGPVDIFGTGTTKIATGDSETVDVNSDDTVRVIWTASGGGDSAPLGNWEGPDA